ncbi:uncharacterized protein LOC110653914 isoform X2 [Hevea brasiliensis]|uniref:uncharacterized protein LOC110653914 isoform X2 n=1 Tax=Hevea brasiliensis TaxID=3981 RepID=UPI0025FE5855|nr:uncharacterized protein LOC110653914 isoform X2 [Hevea brasiliensis]
MSSQGSYNPQSGQGPQTPRTPPFLQHPPAALPPLPHNFQQGPLLPSPQVLPRPGQPGLPLYQHGPMVPHLAVRQVPPGLPNTGQPYLPPPPTVHGSAWLPHVYTTAPPNPQGLQHSSYLAPGLPPPPPPPPGSHNMEMLQVPLPPGSLPPTPSHGQTLYRAPMHQLPHQPVAVQGLQQIPPPPPLPPTFSSFALSGNTLEATVGNPGMSSMVTTPPPPPLPLPSSSPPPIPPSSPPVFSPASVSMPLFAGSNVPCGSNPHSRTLSGYKSGTLGSVAVVKPLNGGQHNIPVHDFSEDDGSLFLEVRSGSKLNYPGGDVFSLNRIVASDVPCPPKPAEEKIVQKIEDLCQLIAKNGSSYEDMARLKESGNPEFKFLFGGEPGSEAAIAHEYFLWMKKQCLLACKSDKIQPAMSTNHLMVTTEPHSPADSDMEMEDDITRSEVDQAMNQPVESASQATDPVSSKFDAKKQLHTLSSSAGSQAATMVLSERQGEEGSKLVSSRDELTFGRSVFGLADDNSSSKAAAAAECIYSDSYSGQVMKGRSPFSLLQDYASNDNSDDDEDPCLKDANPETVSPLVAVGTENLHRDTRLDLKGHTGSKSLYKTERGFGLLPESGMSYKAPDFSSYSQREVKETVPISIDSGLSTKLIDAKYDNQTSVNNAASHNAFPKEDVLGGGGENAAFSGKYEYNKDKNEKSTSNAQKIDRFGRLVREGVTDSDSDDSHHARRQNKRGRSRSQSPLDRRRRNRPRRRREKRSRSRSWSPRNQRSGSRSPSSRHAGEFSSGNRRREKGQLAVCFNFRRGRCYRGASCRYMHHDSEKSDGSKRQRSKQQEVQLPPSSMNCNTHEGNKKLSLKVSDHGQEIMNQEGRNNHDTSASSICATKDNTIFHNRKDSVCDALVDSEIIKFDSIRDFVAEVPKTSLVEERSEDGKNCTDENFREAMESDQPVVVDIFSSKPASDSNILKSHVEASQDVISSLKDSVIQQSQSVQSDRVLEDADYQAQRTDDSSISDTSPDKTSRTSPKNLHCRETLPNSADSVHNPSQIPTFHFSAPNSDANNAPHMTQLSRDYNLMRRTAAFQSQTAPLGNFPSIMLPNQNSLFSLPLNTSSATLPTPPPLLPPHDPSGNAGLLFQQSCFGSQIFSKPYSTELSSNSQVGEFQHRAYPPLQEPHQPFSHLEDFGLKPPLGCNPSSQQFGDSVLFGEDHLKQLPMQATSVSDSSFRSNNYFQPMPFLQEGSATKQSFSGDNLTPGEILKSFSDIDPYLQQRQAPYNLHHSVPDGVYSLPGKVGCSSRYPPELQDRNQPSHPLDFGVSRNSTHFNPYASTFEKPLSSRFSSGVFRQEKHTMYGGNHDYPLGLSHSSVDEQGVGSREATSPTSAIGVGKIIPTSGGDQYDPLFDSIEPSSKSHKKSDHTQKWKPSADANIILRLKGSNQLLDVEENNKKKEVGGIVLATSIDNEEFGETADLGVGVVENGSQSNPNALTNTNMGEVEIEQIKSSGKSKKGKQSRSKKLFKACLADFVKEVLKPSWRQGSMSKETFKTVVKKTVDKVSEAMKSHQIPKSKAKINRYIDSSQRKLTKLVMGYVDKYAKG